MAESAAPLALVYERSTGGASALISGIAIFAVLNGALIQMIMASRVIYGLADQGELPGRLAWIHPRTHTPLVATALVAAVILALALFFPLEQLAETTSVIVLIVFALVNLALVMIKRRGTPPPQGIRTWPAWIPATGFTVNVGFLALRFLWGKAKGCPKEHGIGFPGPFHSRAAVPLAAFSRMAPRSNTKER